MSVVKGLKCVNCGKEHSAGLIYNCQKCGDILSVEYDYEQLLRINTKAIFRRKQGLWKYKEFLPITDYSKVVSLDEGGTSLHKCNKLARRMGIEELYLKDETRNPTGSFKDRPASVAVSKALEFNAKTLVIASTGNAAASAAAYAAKAGTKCVVIIPERVPTSKISQILTYGALVVKVKGAFSNAYELARNASQKYGWCNVTTVMMSNPYQVEGDKTVSYEICEQMRWKVPDWIAIPIGAGPLLVGVWKGFVEFRKLGLIEKLPSMIGVQVESCEPIVKAFRDGKSIVEPWPLEPKTVAGGVADPLRGYTQDGSLTLKVIRESNGLAASVSDQEVLEAVMDLGRNEGVLAEPTGAVAVAGVKKLIEEGKIPRDEVVVCLVTGHGLKDMGPVANLFKDPPTIEPDVEALKTCLARALRGRTLSEGHFNKGGPWRH
jgi:threonine synthase